MSQNKKMAILVGGGPAPGINSVIGAATIRGILSGAEVIGIRDGFKWLMRGNIDNITININSGGLSPSLRYIGFSFVFINNIYVFGI